MTFLTNEINKRIADEHPGWSMDETRRQLQTLNFKSFIGQLFAKPIGDFICPVCSYNMHLVANKTKEYKICSMCNYETKEKSY